MPYQQEVNDDDLTERIIGCAIEVHKALGSRRAERDYKVALSDELDAKGLDHELEYGFEFERHGKTYPGRADVYVENAVVLELKAVSKTTERHFYQTLKNVRQIGATRGLLLNFGQSTIDVTRVANGWNRPAE